MISLQRLLSRDDKFFDLMDGSANEANASIRNLAALLRLPTGERTLDAFAASRRKEKMISLELTEALCRTFVTPLEREDIESLSHALYKIPKTVEKFAERYLISGTAAQKLDLTRHIELLDKAGGVIVNMVHELKSGVELQKVKAKNRELQQIEGDADKLMLDTLARMYESRMDPFDVMLAKDLIEMIEKVFDRCRDVGNIVFHIVLKHS